MDEAFATFLAACIAATFSVILAILQLISSRRITRDTALRELLDEKVIYVVDTLYRTIAASQKMISSNTDLQFQNFRTIAYKERDNINSIRSIIRFVSPDLEVAVVTIRSCPFYISHYKNNRKSEIPRKIIELSTELRREVDASLRDLFFSGVGVGLWRKIKIYFILWKIKKYAAKRAG